MKSDRPLWVHVWGVGRVWKARVAARLGKTGRWRKVALEVGREVQATAPTLAVKKAFAAYNRSPRTCRRCGETWECLRRRRVTFCPRCQNRRREDARPDADAGAPFVQGTQDGSGDAEEVATEDV